MLVLLLQVEIVSLVVVAVVFPMILSVEVSGLVSEDPQWSHVNYVNYIKNILNYLQIPQVNLTWT